MKKLTETLEMGGYGIYIWPSFIIAAIIILAMLILSLHSLRRAQKTLKDLQNSQIVLESDGKDLES